MCGTLRVSQKFFAQIKYDGSHANIARSLKNQEDEILKCQIKFQKEKEVKCMKRERLSDEKTFRLGIIQFQRIYLSFNSVLKLLSLFIALIKSSNNQRTNLMEQIFGSFQFFYTVCPSNIGQN